MQVSGEKVLPRVPDATTLWFQFVCCQIFFCPPRNILPCLAAVFVSACEIQMRASTHAHAIKLLPVFFQLDVTVYRDSTLIDPPPSLTLQVTSAFRHIRPVKRQKMFSWLLNVLVVS